MGTILLQEWRGEKEGFLSGDGSIKASSHDTGSSGDMRQLIWGVRHQERLHSTAGSPEWPGLPPPPPSGKIVDGVLHLLSLKELPCLE